MTLTKQRAPEVKKKKKRSHYQDTRVRFELSEKELQKPAVSLKNI